MISCDSIVVGVGVIPNAKFVEGAEKAEGQKGRGFFRWIERPFDPLVKKWNKKVLKVLQLTHFGW